MVVASAGTPSKAGPSLPAAIVAVARKLAGLIALSLLVASAFILVFYGLTFLVVWPIALHNLPLPSPVVWLVFILPYLGVIVLAFAMMYVVPAVVLGGKNPVTAVASSCALVARNAPASLMAFCAILLVVLGAERITHAALAVPFLSYAAAFFVGGCAAAFAAAVPARFFVLLSAQKRGEI